MRIREIILNGREGRKLHLDMEDWNTSEQHDFLAQLPAERIEEIRWETIEDRISEQERKMSLIGFAAY